MAHPRHHLILGGTGFIGRHVALLLARAGFRVTIASRNPPIDGFPAGNAHGIVWKPFDLSAPRWDDLLTGGDTVHHYAWTSVPGGANASQADDLNVNVGATIGLLGALKRRGHGRIVFASSGGTVYGKLRRIPVDEDHPLAPITAYGAEKAAAELYLGFYRAIHGLDCRIARIANPYGAGQNLARGVGAVTTFLQQALAGQEIVIWGTGEIVRDYLHISDVASCLATLACTESMNNSVFNVGSGSGTSLNEIIAGLEGRLGRRVAVTRREARAFDVPVSVLANGRARRELGWSPRLTLREGTDRALDDLRAGRLVSTLDDWSPPLPVPDGLPLPS